MSDNYVAILAKESANLDLETTLSPLIQAGLSPVASSCGRYHRMGARAVRKESSPELLKRWLARRLPVCIVCYTPSKDDEVWVSFDCRFPPLLDLDWELLCDAGPAAAVGLAGMEFFFRLAEKDHAFGFVFNPCDSLADVDWVDICVGGVDPELADRYFADRSSIRGKPAPSEAAVTIFPSAARGKVAPSPTTKLFEWRDFTIMMEPKYCLSRYEDFLRAVVAHGAEKIPLWL